MKNFNRIIERSLSLRAEFGLDKVDRLYHRYLTPIPTVYGIDPWNSETAQQLPLGAIGYDRFGYKYRYVANTTTALVAGNLIQSTPQPVNFVDLVVPTAAPLRTTGPAQQANNKIGVTLGGTAVTSNQFAGGLAVISASAGIGTQYTIANHDVQVSTTGLCNFVLEENLAVALTTASKVTITPHPYSGVVASPTTPTGFSAGVALFAVPANTTSPAVTNYGWVGTNGVFGVLSDATLGAVGNGISPSTTTVGTITKAVTLKDSIGYYLVTPVSAQVEPVWLNIG